MFRLRCSLNVSYSLLLQINIHTLLFVDWEKERTFKRTVKEVEKRSLLRRRRLLDSEKFLDILCLLLVLYVYIVICIKTKAISSYVCSSTCL